MKPTKAPKNREIITGFMARVELVIYNERGQLAQRRAVEIGVIEADIPEAVSTFLRQRVRMAEAEKEQGGA